jgi:hypothetical protein
MKASLIVSVWLLLTGAIGDAVLRGGDPQRPPALLLLFYLVVSTLTAVALWAEFGEDAPPRRRRMRWHYD